VHEYRNIDTRKSRIILIDGAPAILPTFGEKLGEKAAKRLTKLGVEIKTNAMVTDVDLDGITVKYADGHEERIGAVTKIWAAGVKASPIAALVAEQAGAEVDRSGRVAVLPDLTLPGHPEVFAVGDMMTLDKLPGVAQVAIQGGRYAAQRIMDRLNGKPTDKPFHYKDKGNLATVSRFSAVADLGRFKFAGFFAWLIWLAVHLFYIIGFKKRLTTLLHWTVSFLGASRSERAVTEQQAMAREALELLGESWSAVRSTNPPAAQTPQETGADAVEAIEESEPTDDGARPA
jgi:NADH dehydrogenase